MAVASPSWTYWTAPFIAMTLSPINGDVLSTVSSLIISRAFPDDSMALAGSVFNTISQLGNSVGLAVTAVIAAAVTPHDDGSSSQTGRQLLEGYRDAYWTIFAGMVLVFLRRTHVTNWIPTYPIKTFHCICRCQRVLGRPSDHVIATKDSITVGKENGAYEVSIVSGGARGLGEEAAAGKGPRECGVRAGVVGADDGVGLKLEGYTEGVTGVETEKSTE
ncbi:Major facilitator superfamily domain general substrate transporter, partial [Penicillium freii]